MYFPRCQTDKLTDKTDLPNHELKTTSRFRQLIIRLSSRISVDPKLSIQRKPQKYLKPSKMASFKQHQVLHPIKGEWIILVSTPFLFPIQYHSSSTSSLSRDDMNSNAVVLVLDIDTITQVLRSQLTTVFFLNVKSPFNLVQATYWAYTKFPFPRANDALRL